jgi:hypothetical protein
MPTKWILIIAGHNHLCFPLPQTETNNFKNTNMVHVYCVTYIKSGRLTNILVNIGVMYSVQYMTYKID